MKGNFDQTLKSLKILKYYEHDSGLLLGDKQRFLTTFADNFPTIFVINLKISVRFTLKELTCELSSSSDTISGTEKGGIYFLQIALIFEMKKKNESKRKHRVQEYFPKQEEKRPFNNLTIKIADRESFLVKV